MLDHIRQLATPDTFCKLEVSVGGVARSGPFDVRGHITTGSTVCLHWSVLDQAAVRQRSCTCL